MAASTHDIADQIYKGEDTLYNEPLIIAAGLALVLLLTFLIIYFNTKK
jgi:hypothetical protein